MRRSGHSTMFRAKGNERSLVTVTPSLPVPVMFAGPFRMVVEPPSTVMPYMNVVPVAVRVSPIAMTFYPFRVMPIDPARMVFMPPTRVAPHVMVVPVTIVVLRMRENWH